MTLPTEPTLPIQPPPPLDAFRVPRRIYVLLVVGIFFGAAATAATVLNTKATYDTGVAEQEDVMRNQEILNATCENTRALTEQFATAVPSPCPTVGP